jgi:hypothetical protein
MVELLDKGEILPPAVPLIGSGSVGEPVTDKPLACLHSGTDYLGNVLSPVGSIQKKFGEGFHFIVVGIK